MSPILIATDLSPQAGHALTRACHIATRLQVPLVVLHIVDEQLPLMTRDQQCQQARELLGAQVVLCQSGHPLPVQLRVEAGQVTDSILQVAEEQDVQLIIMGQHHKSHPELFVGTNLERVSRLAPIPVLLIAGEGDDYRSGLLALDFSTCASTALRMAATLLDGQQLHALHVCQPPLGTRLSGQAAREQFIAEQREILEYLLADELNTLAMQDIEQPQITLLVESGEVRAALDQAITLLQPNFIALGGHSRSGLGETLVGGLAHALLHQPPCDVLVAR